MFACFNSGRVTTPNTSVPELLSCGAQLGSTSAVFSANDPNPAPGRLYQFYVNGGVAGGPQTQPQRTVNGLPSNGSTVPVRIDYSDDGGDTFVRGDECNYVAFNENGEPSLAPDPSEKLEAASTLFIATIPPSTGAQFADLYIIDANGNSVFDGPSGPIDSDGIFALPAIGYPLDESEFTVVVDYFDTLPNGTKLGSIEQIYTACLDTVEPSKVMTFDEIEAHAAARMSTTPLHFEDEEDYVGEFMLANVNDPCPYWEYDPIAREVRGIDEPEPPTSAFQLPPPSGGDDTQMIQNAVDTAGARVVGTGGVYQISDDIQIRDNDVRVWDVPTRAREGVTIFWDVKNVSDFRIYRSPMDGDETRTASTGVKADNAPRVHVIKSGLFNTLNKTSTSGAGFHAFRASEGYHIAANLWRDIRNDSGPASTNRANPVWIQRSNSESNPPAMHGVIAGNRAINAWSTGKLRDSDFVTFQGADRAPQDYTLVLGNYAEDFGKRFGKNQDHTSVKYRSNRSRWTIADTAAVNRGRLCFLSFQPTYNGDTFGTSAYNNHHSLEVQDNYTAAVRHRNSDDNDSSLSAAYYRNIRIKCNRFTSEASATSSGDHFGFTNEARFDAFGSTSTEFDHPSLEYADNLFDGGGSLSYNWRTGDGFNFSGSTNRTGNDFQILNVYGTLRNN